MRLEHRGVCLQRCDAAGGDGPQPEVNRRRRFDDDCERLDVDDNWSIDDDASDQHILARSDDQHCAHHDGAATDDDNPGRSMSAGPGQQIGLDRARHSANHGRRCERGHDGRHRNSLATWRWLLDSRRRAMDGSHRTERFF
jgi:hypothetical protein